MSERFDVHKFGGGSLVDASGVRRIAEILGDAPAGKVAIVVSALFGVTDSLIRLLDLAQNQDPGLTDQIAALRQRHVSVVDPLLPAEIRKAFLEALDRGLDDLRSILRSVALARGYSPHLLELVSGYGELWSARIVESYLRSLGRATAYVDARDILVVAHEEGAPVVDWEVSRSKLDATLRGSDAKWLIITGYIASTAAGHPTTLGRNGSDFSASIFGALLKASSITIWKDVDGILSADPKRVPAAIILDSLSYHEALALAQFGAKVLHPMTLGPAMAHGIPIYIRNSSKPALPGTRVDMGSAPSGGAGAAGRVKGFATVEGVGLITVESQGEAGAISISGIAERVFGKLREQQIAVLFISYGGSENCISFAVRSAELERTRALIERDFRHWLEEGLIKPVISESTCSIIAAVGEGISQGGGVTAKFFSALGKGGVRVRAIARASSGRTVSAVINEESSTRALRAVHAGFYLSEEVLAVGVVGLDRAGSAFLDLLNQEFEALRSRLHVALHVRGLVDSRKMVLGDPFLNLQSWKEPRDPGRPADLRAFAAHVQGDYPHAVIVDCSESDELPDHYAEWMARGIHIVTLNKRAGAGPPERLAHLRNVSRESYVHFFAEAAVCAGLPVIDTLRDLVQTGDRIHRIEGVFSSALSYVFNALTPGARLSELMAEAARRGYSSPDVSDEINGMAVARKLVILARELGLRVSLPEVDTRSLLPGGGPKVATAEPPLERLKAADPHHRQLVEAAAQRGEVLRHVGSIDAQGTLRAGLESVPLSHPFARLTGNENLILFRTDRFGERPFILQGPGEDPQLTARSLLSDVLRLAAYLSPRTESRPRPHVSTRELP